MARALILPLVTGLLLAGCGQKGPLYLPAPASSASTPTPASAK